MAEIGLGNAESIDKLEVLWPHISGNKSVFENVSVNQVVRIVEDAKSIEKLSLAPVVFRKGGGHHHHMDH